MVMLLPSNSYRESGKTGEVMGRLSAKWDPCKLRIASTRREAVESWGIDDRSEIREEAP